jgi:catechol 2,3-dioxygenase-like lactoylglutathione lyase family enzyme
MVDDSQLPESRLTHAAFAVTDVDRTVAFYRRYTPLEVVHQRAGSRPGTKVAWLRERGEDAGLTIVLFTAEADTRPPASVSGNTLVPGFHHLGFAVESRAAVDALADRARRDGVLGLPPSDHGEVVGYICTIRDPDGHEIEFSFGQML